MSGGGELTARVDDRRYPRWPIVGVAGAVVEAESVLLIRRGRPPLMGGWTLPGGALEVGETMLDGLVREVAEETGLRVRPVELLATLDRIVRDEAGAVEYHYVLLDWLCEVEGDQDAVAGDDASEVEWLCAEELRGREDIDEATRRVALDALARAAGRI